jgi:hypothetical protein
MPIAKTFKMNDVVVAKALRLRWTPNSSTLSANMALGGTGGPSTSSLRAGTDAAARVGAATSFTSGSWISIVLIGALPD